MAQVMRVCPPKRFAGFATDDGEVAMSVEQEHAKKLQAPKLCDESCMRW